MPRRIEETLIGVQWAVRELEVPQTDERGNVIHGNGAHGPKMVRQWVLDLIDQAPGELRVVHVPFDREARDKLIAARTGGVHVASRLPEGGIEL